MVLQPGRFSAAALRQGRRSRLARLWYYSDKCNTMSTYIVRAADSSSGANRYVLRINRRKASGDPFRALEWSDGAESAQRFSFSVARAVADRNKGIIVKLASS